MKLLDWHVKEVNNKLKFARRFQIISQIKTIEMKFRDKTQMKDYIMIMS